MRIHIQHKAREDLKQIYKTSLREWGVSRADSYYDAMVTAINGLADFPELGFARDDIKSGYRQLSVEKHHIFYRISSNKLHIIRILHDRMLKKTHL